MGSFFHVPFFRLADLQDIDMTTPVLFIIGNETDGLNQHYVNICDIMATIPMSDNSSASSLNVSCAATVMFYEANRQRSNPTIHGQMKM